MYARVDDNDFLLVAFNDAAEQATDGIVRQWVGRSVRDIRPSRPGLLEHLEACFNQRVPLTRHVESVEQGQVRFLIARYAFAPPRFVVVHVEDATDRRQAEVAQQYLGAIIESSDDAIIGKDLDGHVTSWNQAAERLFGYAAEETIGRSMRMIIPPERQGEEDDVLAKIRAGEPVHHFETVRMRRDGSRVDVSVTTSPVRDSRGAIVGASKIARDISERRRVEQLRDELLERERRQRDELTLSRDRLAFLAEVSALLVSTLDYEETLDRAVHLAVPRLGDFCSVLVRDDRGGLRPVASGHVLREKEPLVREIARRFSEAVPADDRGGSVDASRAGRTIVLTREALLRQLARAAAVDRGIDALTAELAPHSVISVPLYVRGRTIGTITFGTTLRESRHEYEEADVRLVEEFARRASLAVENARLFRHAGELNRLKDEFLATLSHELRTPLSAILGWARMLRSGQLSEATRERAIESIERNALAQARLVDDILDVAGTTAGKLRLEVRLVNLADTVRRAVDAITPAAAAKGIHFEISAPEALVVAADEARVQQIAWNLLSNAVKFTPTGGTVRGWLIQRDGVAELAVEDTGMGIAPSFLPYVFDKFRQADSSFSRRYGGLGLGLAIARHLVELHGGTIEASSEGEGRGARFTVRLPASLR